LDLKQDSFNDLLNSLNRSTYFQKFFLCHWILKMLERIPINFQLLLGY